ncbi:EF-hand calcium-binding domain-containing protein 1-like [Gracilinanus agilis]|uniref:EF-hand calcium-binding domain-containing protein 1-like n=1 Tax=Gracilinanus agilis TaxID=191870 RepID=UPI001CFE4707|nr:EF-hand calcium-binding domain-containing protein 1-like [Gracilinanus agilis]
MAHSMKHHRRQMIYSLDLRELKKAVTVLSKAATHFNKKELECLVKLFYSFMEKGQKRSLQEGLDRSEFRNVLHGVFGMTDDLLMNRVFGAFDKDSDNRISATEWVEGLSVFLRGTFEEKLKYCYHVYYVNGDGYISQDEMFDMLKNSLLKHPVEEDPIEGIKELVEITLKKMDYDNDGKLSFEDFEQAVKKDRLLLEVFGPCLPETEKCLEFETLAFKDINNEFSL